MPYTWSLIHKLKVFCFSYKFRNLCDPLTHIICVNKVLSLASETESKFTVQNFIPHGFAFSILYQRGLYAAEKFDRQLAYGLPVQMTNESSVAEYIGKVCEQVKGKI